MNQPGNQQEDWFTIKGICLVDKGIKHLVGFFDPVYTIPNCDKPCCIEDSLPAQMMQLLNDALILYGTESAIKGQIKVSL